MGHTCGVFVLKGERDNRRRGVAGELEVCVSMWILALFAQAGVTDGKENYGCVSVSLCVLNLLKKGEKGYKPVLLPVCASSAMLQMYRRVKRCKKIFMHQDLN